MTDPTLERLRELGGDYVLPFQLEESGLRGRYVRLGGAVDRIRRQRYDSAGRCDGLGQRD